MGPCGCRTEILIRSVTWVVRAVRGPCEARRTQRITGPIRAPVRSLHDCQRTLYGAKIIGRLCMNVVNVHFFLGTGYTAPVRVRNLRKIVRVRTACDRPWFLSVLTLTGPVNYLGFHVTGAYYWSFDSRCDHSSSMVAKVVSPRNGLYASVIIRDFCRHLPYLFQNPISNFYLSLEAGKSSTDSGIFRKLTNVEIVLRA